MRRERVLRRRRERRKGYACLCVTRVYVEMKLVDASHKRTLREPSSVRHRLMKIFLSAWGDHR